MGTTRLFLSPRFASSRRLAQWVALSLIIFMFSSGLFGLPTSMLGAQSHGCAPAVPPPVTNTVPLPATPNSLLINEVLSNPASNWNCSEPNRIYSLQNDSWIEFDNPQNQAFDLYAAHAQISLDGGSSFIFFPFGSAIAAHGWLVIFPQYNQAVASPTPWNVILRIEGTIIDQVKAPVLQADQSYARVPDGSTTWLYAGNPTIDASNNILSQPVTLVTPTRTPTTPGSPTSGATNRPASSGTQPAWKKVQLPTNATPVPAATTTVDPSTLAFHPPQSPSAAASNGLNGWLIALIVLCAVTLLAALTWCWRLFHAP